MRVWDPLLREVYVYGIIFEDNLSSQFVQQVSFQEGIRAFGDYYETMSYCGFHQVDLSCSPLWINLSTCGPLDGSLLGG